MGVQQYEDLSKDVKKLFKLDTKNTSYVIAVVDDEQFLGHVYYGQKLNDYHLDHLLRIEEGPFVPSRNNRDRGSFLDSFRWNIRHMVLVTTVRTASASVPGREIPVFL